MKFKTELSKEDFELSHEVFCKKYRHQPNYFTLLAEKKAGPKVEVKEEAEGAPKKSKKKSKKLEE